MSKSNDWKFQLLKERVEHERELREKDLQLVQHERDLRLISDQHERELRLTAEEAVEKARQIQFNEYERRLVSLNHAHEQAVEAQRLTVPRETFDNYVRETRLANELALKTVTDASDKRSTEVDRRLGLLEGTDQNQLGRRAGVLDARTLIFGLAGAFIGMATLAILIASKVIH